MVDDDLGGWEKSLFEIEILIEPLRQPDNATIRRHNLYVDNPQAERKFARQLAEKQAATAPQHIKAAGNEKTNDTAKDGDSDIQEAPAKRLKA